MAAVRRILVAAKDLRETVRPLMRKAAQIAGACNAHLEIYHCLSDPLSPDFGFDTSQRLLGQERELRAHALQRLERIAVSLRQLRPGLKVSVAAEWDTPVYDAIVRRALKIKADLIVAAGHHGAHMLPGLLRLTDWELVRSSPVPLLLIKNPKPYRRPAILVAVDPAHAFSKPLRLDQALLRAGGNLSRRLGGTLHAVHAYASVPSGAIPSNALAVTDHGLQQVEKKARNAAAVNFERALRGSAIAVPHRYLIGCHPVDAILQAARKSHSSIVVMGAISRSGLKRLLIGNTAESILDELHCDVLVIKPNQFKNRVPRSMQGARIMMPTLAAWPGSF